MSFGLQEFVREKVVKPFARGVAEERIKQRKEASAAGEPSGFESDHLFLQCVRSWRQGVIEGNKEGPPKIVTDFIGLIKEMIATVKKS